MKRTILFFILIIIFSLCKGQEISSRRQFYYYVHSNNSAVDTICNIIYKVENTSSTSLVMMFTEDNVQNKHDMNFLIRRKCNRMYGDFRLCMFAYEPNMSYEGGPMIPETFVKIIKPKESFEITVYSRNEDAAKIDSIFRCHQLLCTAEQMDSTIEDFLIGLEYYKAAYPYQSLTVMWEDLKKVMLY